MITGMGVISPIGNSLDELTENLLSVKSGIHLWESPYLSKKFPAGIVQQKFEDKFTRLDLPYLDRCSQIAVLSARQAVDDAGISDFSGYGQRAGLYYGTARGASASEQEWYEELLIEKKQTARPFAVFSIMHNSAAAQISIRNKILGPVMTISSACTSSGCAIGDAYRAIRDGYLDIAVAGGSEAPFTAWMMGGWDGTRALAPPDSVNVGLSCKPFSTKRTGLVIGEGGAYIVLESREEAERRSAKVYARLSGYGIASDGYHIGSPQAEGQRLSMMAALADADCRPESIDYINAHATATKGGDKVEATALRQAFGDAIDSIPVSSTKSVHGHLLGAASALEVIITVQAMKNSFVPATLGLDEIDPECDLCHVPNTPLMNRKIRHAMSFSSGLGGTNTALIVSSTDTS